MKIYPRHRWVGGDQALSEFILLEGVHQLGSQTWARFRAEFGAGPAQPNIRHPPRGEAALAGDRVQRAAGRGGGDSASSPSSDEAAGGDNPAELDANKSRKDAEKHRGIADDFIASRPLGTAIVARQVMSRLLASYRHT